MIIIGKWLWYNKKNKNFVMFCCWKITNFKVVMVSPHLIADYFPIIALPVEFYSLCTMYNTLHIKCVNLYLN